MSHADPRLPSSSPPSRYRWITRVTRCSHPRPHMRSARAPTPRTAATGTAPRRTRSPASARNRSARSSGPPRASRPGPTPRASSFPCLPSRPAARLLSFRLPATSARPEHMACPRWRRSISREGTTRRSECLLLSVGVPDIVALEFQHSHCIGLTHLHLASVQSTIIGQSH